MNKKSRESTAIINPGLSFSDFLESELTQSSNGNTSYLEGNLRFQEVTLKPEVTLWRKSFVSGIYFNEAIEKNVRMKVVKIVKRQGIVRGHGYKLREYI